MSKSFLAFWTFAKANLLSLGNVTSDLRVSVVQRMMMHQKLYMLDVRQQLLTVPGWVLNKPKILSLVFFFH